MITDGIINAIWSLVSPLLAIVPVIEINTDGLTNSFLEYIRFGFYFLPMDTVSRIFSLTLSLWLLRIVIAVLRAFWDALPIL